MEKLTTKHSVGVLSAPEESGTKGSERSIKMEEFIREVRMSGSTTVVAESIKVVVKGRENISILVVILVADVSQV